MFIRRFFPGSRPAALLLARFGPGGEPAAVDQANDIRFSFYPAPFSILGRPATDTMANVAVAINRVNPPGPPFMLQAAKERLHFFPRRDCQFFFNLVFQVGNLLRKVEKTGGRRLFRFPRLAAFFVGKFGKVGDRPKMVFVNVGRREYLRLGRRIQGVDQGG